MEKQSGFSRAQSTNVLAPRELGRAVQSAKLGTRWGRWSEESGSGGRTDSEHEPGLHWEYSGRYMQESAKQAGFYQSSTIKTHTKKNQNKKPTVEKANGNYMFLELPFSKNLL